MVRALRHGRGPVQNAPRRGCVRATAQHAHFVHDDSLHTGEVLHAHGGQRLDKNVYPLLAVIAGEGATHSPTGAGAA